ncbi:MAG: hypothetical protein R6U15_08170 [Candidatus Izemoplasmatales bacterium]
MTIKEFYLEKFPTDDLGLELNENATFKGLFQTLVRGNNVYDYFEVGDSLIRERLFEELARQINKSYDFIYLLWLK